MSTRIEQYLERLTAGVAFGFRFDYAHEEARMEDAERSGAPDGTIIDGWVLSRDASGTCHWLLG